MRKILIIIVILFIGFLAVTVYFNVQNKSEYFSDGNISSYTTAKRNNWDLFLYSSESPNTEYKSDVIKGFANMDVCIQEGIKKTKDIGSYECGYRCKTQNTDIEGYKNEFDICEKVCTLRGCRD